MSFSRYAEVYATTDTMEPINIEYGQLDRVIRAHKMIIIKIKPIHVTKTVGDFHDEDEFNEDQESWTILNFFKGKFDGGMGESSTSEMIILSFKRAGKVNYDEFMQSVLTNMYGSSDDNISRMADSL